jgi:hypothetical protein
LIDVWPSILQIKPDASLIISSYQPFPREHDVAVKEKMDTFTSIQHVGKLTPQALYEEMAVAEYWLFPSTFLETSCITAREMMASKVKCYYYPVGGITETMGGFGIPMVEGNELAFQEYDLEKAKEHALSFSWERSAALWTSLIKVGVNPYNPNLPSRESPTTPSDGVTGSSDGVVGESPYTGDEADLPCSSDGVVGASPYLEVEDGVIGVNEIVQPYVEVDSTGIVVKGDESEIINL